MLGGFTSLLEAGHLLNVPTCVPRTSALWYNFALPHHVPGLLTCQQAPLLRLQYSKQTARTTFSEASKSRLASNLLSKGTFHLCRCASSPKPIPYRTSTP